MRSGMGSERYRMTKGQLLLLVGVGGAMLVLYRWLLRPRDVPSQRQIQVYRHFVDSISLNGRLTSVDMGRGMKIRVDDGPRIEMPGMMPLDSVLVFSFETGSNMGDSIIKERGNDTVRVRTSEGRWTMWRASL